MTTPEPPEPHSPLNIFKKFKEFNRITELRLINAFIVAISLALLTPIIVSLKGIYLATWVISIFSIVQTLAVKTNNYILKTFTIEQMFRQGIFIHIIFVLLSILYFYDPLWMVVADSVVAIIEVSLFSSFSIALNNYITDVTPDEMSKFQVVRNSTWADGFLLGLSTVTLITYFSTVGSAVITFIVFNTIFSIWLISKWNFYKGTEYCTAL